MLVLLLIVLMLPSQISDYLQVSECGGLHGYRIGESIKECQALDPKVPMIRWPNADRYADCGTGIRTGTPKFITYLVPSVDGVPLRLEFYHASIGWRLWIISGFTVPDGCDFSSANVELYRKDQIVQSERIFHGSLWHDEVTVPINYNHRWEPPKQDWKRSEDFGKIRKTSEWEDWAYIAGWFFLWGAAIFVLYKILDR
jgi:hypothetical protein